jgi:hypothetical protein
MTKVKLQETSYLFFLLAAGALGFSSHIIPGVSYPITAQMSLQYIGLQNAGYRSDVSRYSSTKSAHSQSTKHYMDTGTYTVKDSYSVFL